MPIKGPSGATAVLMIAVALAACRGASSEASPLDSATATTSASPVLPTEPPSASPLVSAAPQPTIAPGETSLPQLPAVGPVRWPAGLSAMSLVSHLLVRSAPSRGDESIIYQPSLPTGARFRILEGPVAGSGYWWYRVGDLSETLNGGVTEGWLASADTEGNPWIGPSPDACAAFPFAYADITVSSFADLQAGVVDSWAGCVSTPWVPPYWVTVTLRSDGTYSARALVNAFVDPGQPAFYYGTDEDSPSKRYAVNDLQASGLGIGEIDIYFGVNNVARGELRNIRLMGDHLEFEFFHFGQYGPLTYRLYRIGTPD